MSDENYEDDLPMLSKEQLGDILEVGDTAHDYSLIDDDMTDSYVNHSIDRINEILNKYPVGLIHLFKGYMSYCAEVIISRALCGIDGLKPVQRRILITMLEMKLKQKTKCVKISGAVTKYHPHSDVPVYEALTRMTDSRGMMNIPLIAGQGTFGDVYSSKRASASRYTEAELHPYASDYFGEMNGVKYTENYDNTAKEPILLPVRYPSILVNPTQGIAVGLASNIPSFNIIDVIDLAIEYLETGDVKTVIYPDHRCGSIYVKDEAELFKVMTTGKGKLKFRARAELVGKEIHFTELPFGVTKEALKKQILDADIYGVSDVKDLSDKDGLDLAVYCKNTSMVSSVLMTIYKLTDAQYVNTANMTVIIDNQPKLLGVWPMIKEWCRFRCDTLIGDINHDKKELIREARLKEVKIAYLANDEAVSEVLRLSRYVGKKEAKKYVAKVFPDFSNTEINMVCSLPTDQLGEIDVFKNDLEGVLTEIDECDKRIATVSTIAVNDLKKVRAKFSFMKRHTEVTDLDYNFESEESDVSTVDETPCTICIKDNFLKKIPSTSFFGSEASEAIIEANANDTLIGVDTNGRVLRVYLSNIDYCSASSIGTFLPKYWGIEENELMWLDVLDGREKTIVYSDGKVGFLDTSEWFGNSRQVKVIEAGISAYAKDIVDVIDTPEVVLVVTKKGKMSILVLENTFRERKPSRTARKSIFKLDEDDSIVSVKGLSKVELIRYINNSNRYLAPRVKYLEEASDILDNSIFR